MPQDGDSRQVSPAAVEQDQGEYHGKIAISKSSTVQKMTSPNFFLLRKKIML